MTVPDAEAASVASASTTLILAQLRGIEAWLDALHDAQARALVGAGRESRMDVDRLLAVRRRQHDVIIDRCGADLLASGTARPPMASAVVAHHHTWSSGKLVEALDERGIIVLAAVDDGAEAVGVCVAEQPTLLIVGEHLIMQSGEEVVREVRRFCPSTIAAGYVVEQALVALLDAGTTHLFTRGVDPAVVVSELAKAVHERRC